MSGASTQVQLRSTPHPSRLKRETARIRLALASDVPQAVESASVSEEGGEKAAAPAGQPAASGPEPVAEEPTAVEAAPAAVEITAEKGPVNVVAKRGFSSPAHEKGGP